MQCSCNDEYDPKYHKWGYDASNYFRPLSTKRGRRCISCKSIIKPGDEYHEMIAKMKEPILRRKNESN